MISMPTISLTGLTPSLYENARAFQASDGNTRIFAPVSYSTVRNAQIVPIVHVEALTLAHWFPVCWQITNGLPVMVVLRTLKADGSNQPQGSPDNMASLPLALRAYPFVVGAADAGEERHLFDDAIPDQPSDIGAPIMTSAGVAGAGAKLKMQAKAAFNHALPLTTAMTVDLVRNNLLQPWPLEFDVGGEMLTVNDLFVVKTDEFSSPKMLKFIEAFGPTAGMFLGAHRISLFRAGILVRAASRPTSPPSVAS
jgi:hypothetical protein